MLKELLIALLGAGLGLLASEFGSWAPRLAAILTRRTARFAPRELRDRLAEEWQSHVDAMPGPLSKLLVAGGLIIAVVRVRAGRTTSDRAFDVVVSGAMLFMYSPIWAPLIIAMAVHGRRPLRTRIVRGPSGPFAQYEFNTTPDDLSLTRFLTHFGFTKFPRLINVFRGEMTFFGPNVRCDCAYCSRERLNGARPGMISASKVDRIAAAILGTAPAPASTGPLRRNLRAVGLIFGVGFVMLRKHGWRRIRDRALARSSRDADDVEVVDYKPASGA